ncbi:MAG: glycosyltransferase family 2 protein [Egibacteraceae bacterium]
MPAHDTLVSIGLPVRNGEQYVERALRSVLSQEYSRVELVISDNASEDRTEEICREYARSDERVRYYRQPENIGLQRNFMQVAALAKGEYFRWLGMDDWLDPAYTSRCLEVFAAVGPLILVTTQQAYVSDGGPSRSDAYTGDRLRSERPGERFAEMLRLLNESYLLMDPVYGLMRRAVLSRVRRPCLLYEDEVLAARLALAGPFGHIPEILAYRGFRSFTSLRRSALRLGVPVWHARVAMLIECRELYRCVREASLDPSERRDAIAAIVAMYCRRHGQTVLRRGRKLAGICRSHMALARGEVVE